MQATNGARPEVKHPEKLKKKNPTSEEVKARVASAVIPTDPQANLDEFQLAKLLGVSVHKLRRDRWAGGGCPYVVLGGSVRYRRADVDAFLTARVRRSTSDQGAR
ncbi:helix-turn-helix domain-containing protein [Geobacter anodireducens]|uniref:helix-turn-helix domain-containing protein n=1 Tax=Geobacter soli TaxID=1510391 RepID=UPI0009E589BB|nr:helix-turn-helix domain-containing protein [Geobacter soli]